MRSRTATHIARLAGVLCLIGPGVYVLVQAGQGRAYALVGWLVAGIIAAVWLYLEARNAIEKEG